MKNKEISNLMSRGRAYNSSSFLLRTGATEDILTLNDAQKTSKIHNKAKNIAFLAPKKVFSTAVLRNKAKRRLKSAFQKAILTTKDDFKPKNKLKIIITAKKQVIDIDFESLYKEMELVLAKI